MHTGAHGPIIGVGGSEDGEQTAGNLATESRLLFQQREATTLYLIARKHWNYSFPCKMPIDHLLIVYCDVLEKGTVEKKRSCVMASD